MSGSNIELLAQAFTGWGKDKPANMRDVLHPDCELGMGPGAAETDIHADGSRAGKGRAYWFYGDLVIVHVSGGHTQGRYCLVEFLQPPGEWTPLHVHKDSDQSGYVLEGELTVYLPGESFVVGPGECVNTPMSVPHTECVTSAGPVRLLDVNGPAGFDEFVAAAGEPAAEMTLPPPDRTARDPERFTALAAAHATAVLGPPGSLP